MVTSLTSATGWIARLLLSAAVLCFNVPRLAGPAAWTHQSSTKHVDTQSDDGKDGFHMALTVGRGKKQVTVEFGHAGERAEDESL